MHGTQIYFEYITIMTYIFSISKKGHVYLPHSSNKNRTIFLVKSILSLLEWNSNGLIIIDTYK